MPNVTVGVSRTISVGSLLYLFGWIFPPEAADTVLIEHKGKGYATFRRENAGARQKFPAADPATCGFEGVLEIGSDAHVAGKLVLRKGAKAIAIPFRYDRTGQTQNPGLLLTSPSPALQKEAARCLGASCSAGPAEAAVLYWQLRYCLGGLSSEETREYMGAIARLDDRYHAWIVEQELPWLLFLDPGMVYDKWFLDRRKRMLELAARLFPPGSATGISRRKEKGERVAVLVDGLHQAWLASAVLELGIAREIARRGIDVLVVVSDFANDETGQAATLRRKKPQSGRWAEDHRSLAKDVSVHYCTAEGYIERMEEAYRVVDAHAPRWIADITAWGTILSAALHEAGYPVVHITISDFSSSAVFDRYIARSKALCLRANKRHGSIPEETICEVPGTVQYDLDRYPAKEIRDERLEGDAFKLVTAGNRLKYELRPDFLATMAEMLGACPGLRWIVVGKDLGDRFREAMRPFLASGQAVAWGFEENLPALYRQCDAYVNPDRLGGGGSVVMAMRMGLPVVMTRFPSDILPVVKEENCLDSYGDMAAYVAALQERAFYRAESRKMLELANRPELRTDRFVDGVLAAARDIEERGRWSWQRMAFTGA